MFLDRSALECSVSMPCVRRQIGPFCVCLRSESPPVADDFAALYHTPWLETQETSKAIDVEVRRSGRSRLGRRLYAVYADGEQIGGLRPSNGVFPIVEWAINQRIVATRPEYLQIHAASISLDGAGFIFAGDSGCGKSTLAAALCKRGWQYFCDEFALVERESLTLQTFPKALCIKSGSFPLMRGMRVPFAHRRHYVKEFKGRVAYVDPHAFGPRCIADPVPVRFIIFPRYHAGSKPHLVPISPALAVLELFKLCFNRPVFRDGALPLLTRIASGAQCFRLDVGDAGETARLLESLVGLNGAPIQSPSDASLAHAPHNPAVSPLGKRGGRNPLPSRREILRLGAKLAYVAPVVITLSAHEAFAATSNPSGICSTGKHTGQLCETDSDCCTHQCALGVCR